MLVVHLCHNEGDISSHEVRVGFHCDVEVVPIFKDYNLIVKDLEFTILVIDGKDTGLEEGIFIRSDGLERHLCRFDLGCCISWV